MAMRHKGKRAVTLATAAACWLATLAAHAAPAKLWETGGFLTPESALFDAKSGVLYVSNVNGAPDGKDGNGFISKVAADGQILTLKWAAGMDAPKGLGLFGGKLYVADIDRLHEIDTSSGKVTASYPAADAKFLNDVAVDGDGNVYVSDMATNVIWRLANGTFAPWLQDAKLENPNGLAVEGGNLRVATWGVMSNGFETKVPGHLISIAIGDKHMTDLGDGKPFGNLDGLEPLGGGAYLVSDWMTGKVMRFAADGTVTTLLELGQGSADIGYDANHKTLYVPQMMQNTLAAYGIER